MAAKDDRCAIRNMLNDYSRPESGAAHEGDANADTPFAVSQLMKWDYAPYYLRRRSGAMHSRQQPRLLPRPLESPRYPSLLPTLGSNPACYTQPVGHSFGESSHTSSHGMYHTLQMVYPVGYLPSSHPDDGQPSQMYSSGHKPYPMISAPDGRKSISPKDQLHTGLSPMNVNPSQQHAKRQDSYESLSPRSRPPSASVPVDSIRSGSAMAADIFYPPFELEHMPRSVSDKMKAFNIRPWLQEANTLKQPGNLSTFIADHLWQMPYNSTNSSNGRFARKTGRDCFYLAGYRFDFDKTNKPCDVFWDYKLGLVRMASILKPLNQQKTLPNDIIEKSGLQEVAWNITGGRYEIQGYWISYEAARAIAKYWCYDFRYALVPLFGPDFPDECEPEDGPNWQRKDIGKAAATAYKHSPLGAVMREQARKTKGSNTAVDNVMPQDLVGTPESSASAPAVAPRKSRYSPTDCAKRRPKAASRAVRSSENTTPRLTRARSSASFSPEPSALKKRKTFNKPRRKKTAHDASRHDLSDAARPMYQVYPGYPGGFTAVNHLPYHVTTQTGYTDPRHHVLTAYPERGVDHTALYSMQPPYLQARASASLGRGHDVAAPTAPRPIHYRADGEDGRRRSIPPEDLECALSLANMHYMSDTYDSRRARWKLEAQR